MQVKPLEELLQDARDGAYLDAGVIAAEEMARRLRKLAERHQREEFYGYNMHLIVRCRGCREAWPCPDAEILEGRGK